MFYIKLVKRKKDGKFVIAYRSSNKILDDCGGYGYDTKLEALEKSIEHLENTNSEVLAQLQHMYVLEWLKLHEDISAHLKRYMSECIGNKIEFNIDTMIDIIDNSGPIYFKRKFSNRQLYNTVIRYYSRF